MTTTGPDRAPGPPRPRPWLFLPVIAVAAVNSGFSWFAMVVSACGIGGSCAPDVWQTRGPYVSIGIGLVAAAVSGSAFAFVPWARRRTRFTVGGVVAVAWIAYTTQLALSLT